jgi:hypothetical protein
MLPINAFWPAHDPWQFVLAAGVTVILRKAVTFLLDLDAKDFSAHCTRAGGAMALLCGGIGNDRIRLIGRWRSDEVYLSLHAQAQPVKAGVARAILRRGDFRLNLPPFSDLPAPLANKVQPRHMSSGGAAPKVGLCGNIVNAPLSPSTYYSTLHVFLLQRSRSRRACWKQESLTV